MYCQYKTAAASVKTKRLIEKKMKHGMFSHIYTRTVSFNVNSATYFFFSFLFFLKF